MAQEAAGWLHNEEEGKRKAAQEAAEKAQEATKEAEEASRKAAEEAKRKLDEELQKQEAERLKLTQTETKQSASEIAGGQTQKEYPEVQDPQVPAASTPVVSTLKLVPFVQKKGEEIPDFTLFSMIEQQKG